MAASTAPGDALSGPFEISSKVVEADAAVGVGGSGDTAPTATGESKGEAVGDATRSLTMGTAREILSTSNDTNDTTDAAGSEVFDSDSWEASGDSDSYRGGAPENEETCEPLAELELESEGKQDSHASSWTSVSTSDNDESSIGWDSVSTSTCSTSSSGSSRSSRGLSSSSSSSGRSSRSSPRSSTISSSSSSSSSSGGGGRSSWRCSCPLCRRRRVVGFRLMSKRSRRLWRVMRCRNRRHRRRRRLQTLVANYSYNIWHWRSSSADSLSSGSRGLSSQRLRSRGAVCSEATSFEASAACSRAQLLGVARSWDSVMYPAAGGRGDAHCVG